MFPHFTCVSMLDQCSHTEIVGYSMWSKIVLLGGEQELIAGEGVGEINSFHRKTTIVTSAFLKSWLIWIKRVAFAIVAFCNLRSGQSASRCISGLPNTLVLRVTIGTHQVLNHPSCPVEFISIFSVRYPFIKKIHLASCCPCLCGAWRTVTRS